MLLDENIQRALVSATPTEGAELLYRENPQLVIPMLRPYRSWRHRYLWFKDPELINYLHAHLARVPYRGIGEFHVFGNDMSTPEIEQMISLARKRKLALHPHTDLHGMNILLSKAEDVVVLWAHGGFNTPVQTLRNLLDEYPNLYIELSLREGMLDNADKLTRVWYELLLQYPQRFLVGMDTYKPGRWADLPEIAESNRHWLHQLPDKIASQIARGNLDRLFPPLAQ